MIDSISSTIRRRLRIAGIEAPTPIVADCAQYVALLSRWNARINLTALPVTDPIPDATIDKLVVESLIGYQLFPVQALRWIDVGSGGGSPAIPLRLLHQAGSLTMVESRSRKCAFLREVGRQLALPFTTVENVRFDSLEGIDSVDVITIRAVKLDEELLDALAAKLNRAGSLIGFGAFLDDPRFAPVADRLLPDGSRVRRWTRTDVG